MTEKIKKIKTSTRAKAKSTKKKTASKAKSGARSGNLVIVESPAKARTINKILGGNFKVKASIGHIRDLPQKRLGVDIKEKTFAPKYEVPKEKREVVAEIKEAAEHASAVYLATDPDREGEAISWHLVEAAKLDESTIKRVVFHEITKDAVQEAFKHPRDIDMNLVNAQQARRILDRLVGYKLSPWLNQKIQGIQGGLSAGRVQSVALKLVVNREREIESFIPKEYWSIDANLEKIASGEGFTASFVGHMNGTKIDIKSEGESSKIVAHLNDADYKVAEVRKKETPRQPAPPFTTSTLQQESWRKLRFSAQRTMSIAQQLYEGLALGKEGATGLITYMRTDSTKVATSAIEETRTYIKEKLGEEFLPKTPRVFQKKSKGAQEAHEAIRPTLIMREPSSIEGYLNKDQLRLYELIWKRMVSSQMSPAIIDTTTADIEAKARQEKLSYLLRATSTAMRFKGFTILYSEGKDESEENGDKSPLPVLIANDPLKLLGLKPEQHFTQPPSRYTQATLIKALEERGIGRPSTYAPILGVIQERDYVMQESMRFKPTDLGMTVSDMLSKHFPNIVDFGFTAQMEEGLDLIAQGKKEWVPFLSDFYVPFEASLIEAKDPDVETNELCEKCGKPMVIKTGRYGKFMACTGYPEVKHTKPIQTIDEPTNEACEVCGKPMVIKTGRYGKFMACTGYPEVKHTKPIQTIDEPTNEACEICGKPMVIKTGRYGKFMACTSYPKVKHVKKILKKIGIACPKCGRDIVQLTSKKKRTFYGCSGYHPGHPDSCEFTSFTKPISNHCPQCRSLMVMSGKDMAKCTQCAFSSPLDKLEVEAVKA